MEKTEADRLVRKLLEKHLPAEFGIAPYEAALPLLTVRGKDGLTIGFDVRVNDAQKGKLAYALQWSDGSSHTDVNLHGVGLLTFGTAEENEGEGEESDESEE